MTSPTRLVSATLFAAALALSAPGCGKGLSGTYADPDGVLSVTFKSGGKATVGKMGLSEEEATYVVDGDKVTLTPATGGAGLPLTIKDDGSLQIAGDGPVLKKK